LPRKDQFRILPHISDVINSFDVVYLNAVQKIIIIRIIGKMDLIRNIKSSHAKSRLLPNKIGGLVDLSCENWIGCG